MKKKVVILSIYLVLILTVFGFIIYPSCKKLNKFNKIKDITYEEKIDLINELENKYIKDENEIKEKYSDENNKIKENYEPKYDELEKKYVELKKETKNKYDLKEQELTKKINSKRVEANKEFFRSGLSNKYYTLSEEINKLTREKTDLSFECDDEIRKLEGTKSLEIVELNKQKNEEINKNKEKENNELNIVLNSKQNEIDKINSRNSTNKLNKIKAIIFIIIGIIIILIPLGYIMIVFNKLTKLYNNVKEKWSTVNVYLKQRTDLIPNIVETVKGVSGHEKETLTDVINARNKVLKSENINEEIIENEKLSKNLDNLFVLIESYPELKANTNFINLQNNLKEIENKIAFSRTNYNKAVLKYKNKLEMFPSNLIGQLFNFKPELFFEIEKDEKENVKIKF